MNYQAATYLDPKSIRNHLLLAIDLGFSSKNSSCGLAWQDASGKPKIMNLTFGNCLSRVAELLHEHEKVALIIEAPLSALFDEDGNPMGRGNFEKVAPDPSVKGARYWFTGGGASIGLGAIFFLRNLGIEMQESGKKKSPHILLFEGFLTFKPPVQLDAQNKVSSKSSTHSADALLLLQCLTGQKPCNQFTVEATNGQRAISITDMVMPGKNLITPPVIIQPQQMSCVVYPSTSQHQLANSPSSA